MAELTAAQIAAARERGKLHRALHPTAVAARYDGKAKRIVVELSNGATFAFPPALVEALADANERDLAEVEVIGAGEGLHWERLDADYQVAGLLNGVFGTASWMAARAGRRSTPAKAAAARENGKKGGRPRKAG
jgi:hypothetical protein